MPAKVLPGIADIGDFSVKIGKAGFRKIGADEFRQQFRRYGLIAPRPRIGREMGFIFQSSGLSVYIWTTWLEEEKVAREFDSGWVLIIQEGQRAYCVRLNRTKNFLLRLYRFAVIARKRIVNRPICPECMTFMKIVFGRGIRSRYWACDFKKHERPELIRKDFDWSLTPEMLEFLKRERKIRARWREKMRGEGKPVGMAIFRRKPWIVTRPPVEIFR